MKLATTTGDFGAYTDSYLEQIKHVHDAGFRYLDLSLYTIKENDPRTYRRCPLCTGHASCDPGIRNGDTCKKSRDKKYSEAKRMYTAADTRKNCKS